MRDIGLAMHRLAAILQAEGACFERIMAESEAAHLPEMENAWLRPEAARRMLED